MKRETVRWNIIRNFLKTRSCKCIIIIDRVVEFAIWWRRTEEKLQSTYRTVASKE